MPEVESAETMIARLDERLRGMGLLFEKLVDEQRRMATSYEELVRGQYRVGQLEKTIESFKEELQVLWGKFDALAAAETKKAERWKGEIVRTVLTVAAAMFLYHFGVHPL